MKGIQESDEIHCPFIVLYTQWYYYQNTRKEMEVKKTNHIVQWRENNHAYYDFIY